MDNTFWQTHGQSFKFICVIHAKADKIDVFSGMARHSQLEHIHCSTLQIYSLYFFTVFSCVRIFTVISQHDLYLIAAQNTVE